MNNERKSKNSAISTTTNSTIEIKRLINGYSILSMYYLQCLYFYYYRYANFCALCDILTECFEKMLCELLYFDLVKGLMNVGVNSGCEIL